MIYLLFTYYFFLMFGMVQFQILYSFILLNKYFIDVIYAFIVALVISDYINPTNHIWYDLSYYKIQYAGLLMDNIWYELSCNQTFFLTIQNIFLETYTTMINELILTDTCYILQKFCLCWRCQKQSTLCIFLCFLILNVQVW